MPRLLAVVGACLAVAIAEPGVAGPLTAAERSEVVQSIRRLVTDYYVFPDVAARLSQRLAGQLESGSYDGITDPVAFEARLDRDIREATQDNHFKVLFDADWVAAYRQALSPAQKRELQLREREEAARVNFGLQDARMLEGRVGYLRLASFENPEWTAAALGQSMDFLSNSDALIIDLRNNSGGYSELMQILCSYFFNPNDVYVMPLVEIKLRDGNEDTLIQHNVLTAVHGRKMLEQKVYVLTNHRTFSAAEWTAFVLQNRRRATVVGEQTIGGTHPADRKVVSDRFSINIPFGTMVDAVTRTHFEGVGVRPDVPVAATDALLTAQLLALETLARQYPERAAEYDWHLAALRAQQKPVRVPGQLLRSYVGKYGVIELQWSEGRLVSVREGIRNRLVPIGRDLFLLEGRDDARYRVIVERGRAVALERLFSDGRSVRDARE
jgi:hypothetical protein